MHQVLAVPRRSLTVAVPLRREEGSSTVLTGYLVQHDLSRGPAKGGIRFSPHADLAEVTALAMWMTWARSSASRSAGPRAASPSTRPTSSCAGPPTPSALRA